MLSCLSNGWPAVLLEEMTGQFTSKLESTVTIMMRVILKMKINKHPLLDESNNMNANALKLYQVLGRAKHKINV